MRTYRFLSNFIKIELHIFVTNSKTPKVTGHNYAVFPPKMNEQMYTKINTNVSTYGHFSVALMDSKTSLADVRWQLGCFFYETTVKVGLLQPFMKSTESSVHRRLHNLSLHTPIQSMLQHPVLSHHPIWLHIKPAAHFWIYILSVDTGRILEFAIYEYRAMDFVSLIRFLLCFICSS